MDEEKKKELHPVVELFLNRIASHPEELAEGRWGNVEEDIMRWGSEEEREAVRKTVSDFYLGEAHQEFMRALLADKEPKPETTSGGWSNAYNSVLGGLGIGTATTPINIFASNKSSTTFNTPLKVQGDIEYTGRLRRVKE